MYAKTIHPNYSRKISTSRRELKDLFKAWLGISIAFALVLKSPSLDIFTSFIISAVAVGSGFLLHELAHKIVAQHYGCFAEFRSDDKMLIVAVVFAFLLGFVFAAPGAVIIFGHLTRKQNGIVSVAGPVTNIGLSILFLTLSVLTGFKIAVYGAMINAFLAFFNLLPFGMFDGKKVLVFRIMNDGQKAQAISILDVAMIKHSDENETWWMTLPNEPQI